MSTKGITIRKVDDMTEWYGQVVTKAEVADYAPIRGFMVIRPRGYMLWEAIQDEFNKLIKAQGVRNAYFPLLIPESFFHREAEHAAGFQPEVAWLERQEGEERLAIRPTSETIIYDSYSRWIRSWRDLPLRINQWCNVVRWEVKDTKIFLRSREFLWQEGHCVYETEKECHQEVLLFLELYRKVAEELLAVPVILGRKTESEKFAGADKSYTIEGFMPDGKALQMGTSHHLGQGFARAFGIRFLGKSGQEELPWQSSWGFSTRLLGALIMTHGDDKGLVLPPRAIDERIVIVPVFIKDDVVNAKVLEAAQKVAKELRTFGAFVDDRQEYTVGWKFNEHELQGTPLRIEIGPKDLEKEQVVLVRRDTGEKAFVPMGSVREEARRLLDSIQNNLFGRAKRYLDESITDVRSWEDFLRADREKKLLLANHCSNPECERAIKDETKGVTARCIPLRNSKSDGPCVKCGSDGKYKVYFARAY